MHRYSSTLQRRWLRIATLADYNSQRKQRGPSKYNLPTKWSSGQVIRLFVQLQRVCSMQPLTPDDLLIRPQPVDADLGNEQPKVEQSVALERFQTLEHVIRDSPLNVQPYLELAKIYLQAKRWVDARRVLESACSRFPEDEEATFLLEEAQLSRSLQLHWEAQTAHRDEPTRLTQAGLDQCRIELNVLRVRICRARLKRQPERLDLHLPLASALENLEQRDEAIQSLKLAIEHPKLRSAAALQLGQLFEAANRVPEALSAYRRAAFFRVPPTTTEIKVKALAAAADLAERCNLIDSARRYVSTLVELVPNSVELKLRLQRLQETPL